MNFVDTLSQTQQNSLLFKALVLNERVGVPKFFVAIGGCETGCALAPLFGQSLHEKREFHGQQFHLQKALSGI